MPQHLVIVESPAKAKTINKYLGKDYVVKSSIGHIRDLPSGGGESDGSDPLAKAREAQATLRAKGRTKLTAKEKSRNKRAALIRRMGVDPDHGWAAQYEIMPGKERTVAELKAAAAKADTIYLASDLDREGEAIAWHLKEVLGGDAARFRRVTFSEITKPAIQAAFAAPTDVNMDRVNAQQARRFLDRVVGFEVSPLLWSKVARGLSAGRVQSVAVRLIVEREREISAFVPEEYWEIHAQLTGGVPLRAQVVAKGATTFPKRRLSKAESDAAVPVLKTATYTVAEVERKGARDWPNPPFKTSTLQAAASVRLGFSVKKTMTLAQRLYEAGHITYMRTDAVNLSADAVAAIRSLINARFGADYVPEKAIHYKAGANAQEAHEAIRPSDISALAESLDAEPDQKKLYELIWRQTVACQMPPAEYDTASATIHAGGYTLSASGRVLRFAGWHAVMPPLKREDQPLPPLTAGQTLRLDALDPSRHFTTPPARYSEASLVKELEKRGIGRPSTYAAIISTIQERGYVRLDTRRFFAEKLGDIVTGRLMQAFPDLMDYEFTRSLEGDLDTVAEGKADWKKTLDTFYQGFTDKLEHASERMLSATLHQAGDITCPTCSRPMSIRTGSTGVFLSCTGYGLPPKERCVKTMNLVPGIEAEAVRSDQDAQGDGDDDQGDEADALALNARKRCTICGSAMDAWLVDATRKLHICARNPDCAGVQVEIGAYKIKGYDGPSIPCDKCGKQMQLRTGRFGKYFACTGYPECANTRKLLRSGEAAPPKAKPVPMPELKCEKGGYFVLRDGAAGIFLASNLYPKVRETRNPLVSEVAAHRSALDPKHHYLCDAPQRGADGKPTVIRYARTDKQQYVASEDGAQTWFLVEGRWVLKAATPAPAKDKSKRPAKAR